MIKFRGSWIVSVTAKGVLRVPATLRKQLRNFGRDFYITSDTGDYAVIFPIQVWDSAQQKLLKFPGDSAGKLIRLTAYYGCQASLNREGLRLALTLCDGAHLHGDCIVIGFGNILKVYNFARFNEIMGRAKNHTSTTT